MSNVAMVLALAPADFQRLWMEDLLSICRLVDVSRFKPEDWEPLAWELIRRSASGREFADEDERDEFLARVRQFVDVSCSFWISDRDWEPELLHRLIGAQAG